MKKFYITTPLYYVNDVPHIGHAYTTIAADVLARWKRITGYDVHFLTGTDEHGAKIEKSASDANEAPQVFVNRIAGEFKKLWVKLNISHDDFIQTSEDRHKKVVQQVFEKFLSDGIITKGTYEDWYCIHDESYFSESELIDKKCPQCGRDVQKLKEESYFFKLEGRENDLLNFYIDNPAFLSPDFRRTEIVNFVRSGLKNLSVSRTRVKWGVTVPSDPNHTVYVWFDALLNYISALGYDTQHPSDIFKKHWPADVHLMGKEIFRFHTVIWPAMLSSLGLPLPKKVFAHGWWTVEGTKMSKSLGNVVNPHEMADIYGVDAFRYFLFREVPFGSDGDFSEKALLNRFNGELANNLGNLLQRTSTLLLKHFNGTIPSATAQPALLSDLGKITQQIHAFYDDLKYGDILELLYGLLIRTNKYIDDQAPWKLGADQKDKLSEVLYECLSVIKTIAVFYAPFMPTKMQELWARIGETSKIEQAAGDCIASFGKGQFTGFAKNQAVLKGDPLFMRMGSRWK
jgi:methionyl-tRNA synthetase